MKKPTFAYFDKDGICKVISDTEVNPNLWEHRAEVPSSSNPNNIWFDGENVKEVSETILSLPNELAIGSSCEIPLPENVIAELDGVRYYNKLIIPTDKVKTFKVAILGKERGWFQVNIKSYFENRKEAYPTIGDQLDALWKGGEEAEAMKEKVMAVKSQYPKGS